jgi:hypothetical protein
MMSVSVPSWTAAQISQVLQGASVGPLTQLSALAKSRAIEVLPTPRGPQKR